MFKIKLAIVIVLSLVIGAIGFSVSRFQSATLVVQIKTLEAGERYIYVEDGESDTVSRLTFEIGSAEGDAGIYAKELPRISLKSIRIPPLAGLGQYEIDRITLANSSMTYKWDQNMVCTQQYLRSGISRKEPCGSDAPVISLNSDSSIHIASIPANGFVNPAIYRMVGSIFLSVFIFFCGSYLLNITSDKICSESLRQYTVRAAWIAVILLYGYQLHLLWKYSVDIPYYEEWEFFEPFALPQGLSWQWLTRQISHQRMMAFTKLMAWTDFKLFSLDFVKLKVMNYAVFGCLLLAVVRFKNKVIGERFPFFPLFFVFLLSPIVYEVHAASFQSGETAALLFSVIMLNHLISLEPSYKSILLFSACAVFAMCSLSAGLIYAFVFLLCGTLFTSVNMVLKRIDLSSGWKNILLVWCILAPSILFWFYGFKKPDAVWGVPEWLLPIELKFWSTYFNLLSFGFGFEIEHPLPGIFCLVVVLTPVILLLKDKTQRWEAATWQVTTAILGTLAVIGLLVVGRGNMPFSIKVSRYAIFGYLLIPYASIAWWLVLKTGRQRCAGLVLLWVFCATAYLNDWDYGIYRDVRQQELLNLECVENYSNAGGDGLCPGTRIFPIGKLFDNAKKLDVHFTRQFGLPKGGPQ